MSIAGGEEGERLWGLLNTARRRGNSEGSAALEVIADTFVSGVYISSYPALPVFLSHSL